MRQYGQSIRAWIARHPWIVPAVVFATLYVLNFWLTLIHSDVLYSGPGDHIAGIIWLYDHYSQSPWWHHTSAAAYPWGDNVWSPLYVTGQVGYVLFWLCAKLCHSSVVGYNVFSGIGFLLSFVVSYLFLFKRIIHRRLLSSLLAAIITFTPMALFLDGVGHTSYIFMPGYLIASLWLTLLLFESSIMKYALLLGVLVGLTIYFDPYFVLFIPLALGSFGIALLAMRYHTRNQQTLMSFARRLLVVFGTALIVVLPALWYLKTHASAVQATSTTTRTAMLHDAYSYSAHLSDYLLPSATNPLMPHAVTQAKQHSFHGNDPTFTTYIGYTLVIGVIVSLWWWARHKTTDKHALNNRRLAIALGVVALVAFIFSLPPTLSVHGLTLKMPTWYLVHITSAWRVFARLYTVVQPAMVLIVALCAAEWMAESEGKTPKGYRLHTREIIIGVLCVLLLLEYMPRNPFSSSAYWSFGNNLPRVYSKLQDRSDVHVLAEYPLREQPYYQGSLYLAGQHVHDKATLNAYSPVNDSTYFRESLVDLNSSQTIPVLRFIGVDSLIVWNTGQQQWQPAAGTTKLFGQEYKSRFGDDTPTLYKINAHGSSNRYMAIVDQDFRPGNDRQIFNLPTPISSGVTIKIDDLCTYVPHQSACTSAAATSLAFSTDVINHSTAPIRVGLYKGNSLVAQQQVEPGTSKFETRVPLGAYTIRYDARAAGNVSLGNFQAVQ